MIKKLLFLITLLLSVSAVRSYATSLDDYQVISSYTLDGKHYVKITSSKFKQQWKPEMNHAWIISRMSLKELLRMQERFNGLSGKYTPKNTVILYDGSLEPLMKDFAPGYMMFNIGTKSKDDKVDYNVMTGTVAKGTKERCERCDAIFTFDKVYKKGEMPK